MSDEWGPWIEHDGQSGSPMIKSGCYVKVSLQSGRTLEGRVATNSEAAKGKGRVVAWKWRWVGNWVFKRREPVGFGTDPVLRYCIRKPRGLTILEELIADQPAPVGPKVGA